MYRQSAMTLMECLIAMTLSLILLSIAGTWLASTAKLWLLADQVTASNQRGLTVSALFRDAVERAGWLGCGQLGVSRLVGEDQHGYLNEAIIILQPHDPRRLLLQDQVSFQLEKASSSWLVNKAIGESSQVTILSLSGRQLKLSQPINVGARLVICNDQRHQFVTVDKIGDNGDITVSPPISTDLHLPLQAYRYQTEWFFIAKSKRKDRWQVPIYGLYHRVLSADHRYDALELLDYIDAMQIQALDDLSYLIDVLIRSEQSFKNAPLGVTLGNHYYQYTQPYLLIPWRTVVRNSFARSI